MRKEYTDKELEEKSIRNDMTVGATIGWIAILLLIVVVVGIGSLVYKLIT